jgi:hypothetical protein
VPIKSDHSNAERRRRFRLNRRFAIPMDIKGEHNLFLCDKEVFHLVDSGPAVEEIADSLP